MHPCVLTIAHLDTCVYGDRIGVVVVGLLFFFVLSKVPSFQFSNFSEFLHFISRTFSLFTSKSLGGKLGILKKAKKKQNKQSTAL